MKNIEKMVYQENKKGYNLIMIFIILNFSYMLKMLNNMPTTYRLGIFTMINILLLLLAFLLAVKVKTYSIMWSYIGFLVTFFQVLQMLSIKCFLGKDPELSMYIVLGLSVLFVALGSIISVKVSKERTQFMQEYEINEN